MKTAAVLALVFAVLLTVAGVQAVEYFRASAAAHAQRMDV